MRCRRLIFAGTPDFALASLKALVEADFAPIAVLTQPDRPAGRGRKVVAGPVKRYAMERDIPVWQPATLINNDLQTRLATLEAEAMIVAAYGLLLPEDILALPRAGCINVHASLLPRWRGAAPIQAAILAGERETGISLMRMETGLDTGPVYVQEALPIGDTETAGALHDRLAASGARLLVRHLQAILEGRLQAMPQDDRAASYAGKLRKTDARLDWQLPALHLARAIRAYNPVPGAHFELDGEIVKCWTAELLNEAMDAGSPSAGTLLALPGRPREGLDVACGEGALRLLELQRPGRGRVSAFEFARQVSLHGRRLPA